MAHTRILRSWTLSCCILALATQAYAQDAGPVKWRTDYFAARKEAETKNRPVLIDFVRPACLPCERMEQSTFRDARVVAMLNDKFIPLRINGLEETALASSLKVSLYPTLVFATPDGRIAQTLIGFQDADMLHDQLNRVIASMTPSEALQREYQNAVKWETAGEYSRAISALHGILDDGRGAVLQKNAKDLLGKIEKRADERYQAAKEMHDKGQLGEALEAMTELVRIFPGLAASKDAADQIAKLAQANEGAKLTQRTKRVRELLTQAREFYRTKDYIPCLDRCEIIIANYGDLPEGQQAFALASEIKNNPEWLQGAADVMTDRLGGLYLALADSYLKRGDTAKARFYMERVVQAFPGSRLAESAQLRLTQMRGTVPQPKGLETVRP